MKTIHITTKCCGTCNLYQCNRAPMPGGFVKLEGTNGKCYLIDRTGLPKVWGASCNNWQPWAIVKK